MNVKKIPGTLGFSASTDGSIFDSKGNKRKTYKNLDGYVTSSVLVSQGKWQTFGVHRLVALAHIPFEGNLNELTVNHLNGNVEDNEDVNLEWVSVAQNNVHAILLRGSKQRPVILCKKEDGIHEFISNLFTAAKKFNCDTDLVWEAIRDKRIIQGCILTHHKSTASIPTELHKDNFPGGRGLGKLKLRSIDILNLETQEVKTFSSMHAAAIEHGVPTNHVSRLISTPETVRLFKKKYLIVDTGLTFPTINQDIYEKCLAPFGKEVVAYNVKSNTYFIYKSASDFIKENGLSKKAVTVDLRKNRLRLLGDWWYSYNTSVKLDILKKTVLLYVSRHNNS